MPWSPVPKFPEIFENMKREGLIKEVSLPALQRHIILATGAVKDATIKQTIITMERVHYLVRTGRDGVWEIRYWDTYEDKLRREEEKAMADGSAEDRIDLLTKTGER